MGDTFTRSGWSWECGSDGGPTHARPTTEATTGISDPSKGRPRRAPAGDAILLAWVGPGDLERHDDSIAIDEGEVGVHVAHEPRFALFQFA